MLPPIPKTTHGRAFGLYGDDIAIRWSRYIVARYKQELEQIAQKIGEAVRRDGRSFIGSANLHHNGDTITFWANYHFGSGYYLVNASMREPGVWSPTPARADVLCNEGWDLCFDDEEEEGEVETEPPDWLVNYRPYDPDVDRLILPDIDGDGG